MWLPNGVASGRVLNPPLPNALGAYPAGDPQKPENLAATIYRHLGIERTAAWYDEVDRPNHIYHGEPIAGLA